MGKCRWLTFFFHYYIDCASKERSERGGGGRGMSMYVCSGGCGCAWGEYISKENWSEFYSMTFSLFPGGCELSFFYLSISFVVCCSLIVLLLFVVVHTIHTHTPVTEKLTRVISLLFFLGRNGRCFCVCVCVCLDLK